MAGAPHMFAPNSGNSLNGFYLTVSALAISGLLLGNANPAGAEPVVDRRTPDAGALAVASAPSGILVRSFKNLDGIVLVDSVQLHSSTMDTTGSFVIDTGAGYLGLDADLAVAMGLMSPESDPSPSGVAAVRAAERPLARIRIGEWSRDQVSPVLAIEAGVIRDVTDRPVLGLIGQQLFRDRVLWLDYAEERLELIPAGADPGAPGAPEPDARARIAFSRAILGSRLSSDARAIPFWLAGDGKIVVRGRVGDPSPRHLSKPLTLIVDTGASKTVLFQHAIDGRVRSSASWPALEGLQAPTLIGASAARVARASTLRIEAPDAGTDAEPGQASPATGAGSSTMAEVRDLDLAILDSALERVLSDVIGQPIHGLIGYSFLKRFRVGVDYPHRVLWLDPIPHYADDRPNEYSQVGLQLERRESGIAVVGVVSRSAAERADIRVGDVLVAIDGRDASDLGLLEGTRALEGPPGSPVTLTLRRGTVERQVRLTRQRLL